MGKGCGARGVGRGEGGRGGGAAARVERRGRLPSMRLGGSDATPEAVGKKPEEASGVPTGRARESRGVGGERLGKKEKKEDRQDPAPGPEQREGGWRAAPRGAPPLLRAPPRERGGGGATGGAPWRGACRRAAAPCALRQRSLRARSFGLLAKRQASACLAPGVSLAPGAQRAERQGRGPDRPAPARAGWGDSSRGQPTRLAGAICAGGTRTRPPERRPTLSLDRRGGLPGCPQARAPSDCGAFARRALDASATRPPSGLSGRSNRDFRSACFQDRDWAPARNCRTGPAARGATRKASGGDQGKREGEKRLPAFFQNHRGRAAEHRRC